mgnify:CR=1 FL=1
MKNTFGNTISLTLFGESHGPAIGAVLDGLPPGLVIDEKYIGNKLRRAQGKISTARQEEDRVEFVSGVFEGRTTGTPLCLLIRNEKAHSADYGDGRKSRPARPSHADYTGFCKYEGYEDYRGGGHFSGRLTAPIVFAGAICRQILEEKGIKIAAHIASIGNVNDKSFNPVSIDDKLINKLNNSSFALIDDSVEEKMRAEVESARLAQDSIGGTIECAVSGIEAGIGEPMFEGVEGVIAKAVFGVPAIKGIEFGKGFELSKMRGSQSNDPFEYKDGKVVTKTNNCGGILGGITNGMPVIFKAGVKPTPSISKEQDTVDLQKKENAKLVINGRHDPCIVPRAVPVIEAVTAVAILNLL